jgi:endonuclease/exonuclease/phosphatase family metal-dependent hydrolase
MKFNRIRPMLFATLTLLFGLQLFRVFMPSVIAYLSRSTNAIGQAIFALVVFLTVFLAPFVRKTFGECRALVVTIGGIALVRLAVQFVDAPPLYLVLSALGLILFGWFLPIWQTSVLNRPSDKDIPVLVVALPLAFIVDVMTRTILLTFDFAWRHDSFSLFMIGILVVFTFVLLWQEMREKKEQAETIDEPGLNQSLSFVALGAFLYLALVVINTPAVFIAISGRESIADEFIISCVIVSGLVSVMATNWMRNKRWMAATIVGVVLVGSLALMLARAPFGEIFFGLASLAAWICLSWLLMGTTRTASLQPGLWRASLATFIALVIMLLNVFVVGQYQWNIVTVISGVILAIATVWATRADPIRPSAQTQVQASTLVVIVGVLAWFVFWAAAAMRTPSPVPTVSSPVLRVMTYNIHQGISADGAVDLDEIASVVGSQKLDIVGLNEINRARPNYGLIDTLPLIGRMAQMEYRFGATYDDGQYGNALLTRYPITEWKNTRYAAKSNEFRAVLRAVITTPIGPITFFVTHLDNINGDKSVRGSQVTELLKIWNQTPRSIIVGDLNAEPEKPELQALYQAGLVDALAASGNGDVYTFWDVNPQPGRRIDYILVTPDLKIIKTQTIPTRASDHLPVVAEISVQ